jgi:hypothetical protein
MVIQIQFISFSTKFSGFPIFGLSASASAIFSSLDSPRRRTMSQHHVAPRFEAAIEGRFHDSHWGFPNIKISLDGLFIK